MNTHTYYLYLVQC